MIAKHREQALAICAAALEAVNPARAVQAHVSLRGEILQIGARPYDLRRYRHILVIGAGKASASMAAALEDIPSTGSGQVLGDRIAAGAVNVKYGYTAPTRRIQLHQAGHPVPDEAGLQGTRRIVDLARSATADDLVICLISGGGSALMFLPVEGIDLAAMQAVTSALLACGATINEINAVRKHLDQVKGGQLARLVYPAELVTLILSDVVGNPLDVIASGPTVPDATTFAEACGIIGRYGLWETIPAPVAAYLRQGLAGQIPDTPKQGDPLFTRTFNLVIGSNTIAAEAALAKARELGFNTMLLSTYVEGEAREAGKFFAAIAREIVASGRPVPRPACVVAGGETTVTLRGRGKEPALSGAKGGRNQELALSAAIQMAGLPDALIVTLATDGTDGPTDAAGALADGTTVNRARARGLDPIAYLANNDAYHFFEALGDLLITGPTNTNVNDLTFILVEKLLGKVA